MYPCIPYEMTGRGKVGFFSGFYPVDAILDEVCIPTDREDVDFTGLTDLASKMERRYQ